MGDGSVAGDRQKEGAAISHNRQSDSKTEDLTAEVSGEEQKGGQERRSEGKY